MAALGIKVLHDRAELGGLVVPAILLVQLVASAIALGIGLLVAWLVGRRRPRRRAG